MKTSMKLAVSPRQRWPFAQGLGRPGNDKGCLLLPRPLSLLGTPLAALGPWVVWHERPGFVAQLRSGGLCTDAICPFHVHSHQRTFVLEVMGRHCG